MRLLRTRKAELVTRNPQIPTEINHCFSSADKPKIAHCVSVSAAANHVKTQIIGDKNIQVTTEGFSMAGFNCGKISIFSIPVRIMRVG